VWGNPSRRTIKQTELSDEIISTLSEVKKDSLTSGIERLKDLKKHRALTSKEVNKLEAPVMDPERRILVLPSSIVELDRPHWYMWCYLAEINGLTISTYEDTEKLLKETDQDPVTQNTEIGFSLGVTDSDINFNLKLRDDRIENARCCVFAIRLKRYFETNEKLGSKALIRNQVFFGNNSGARDSNGKPQAYICRALWLTLFTAPRQATGQALWELFVKLVQKCPLVTDETKLNKFVEKYIRTYPEIINNFKRLPIAEPVMVRKGKSYVAERKAKAPEKPSASPLFTYGESKLMLRVLTPLFEQGSTYAKHWYQLVFDDGFTRTYERVERLFNARWACLTAYSRVTTKRLVEIRKLLNAPYLKKAEVPTTAPALLVANRRTPVKNFVQELTSCIPSTYHDVVLSEAFSITATLETPDEALRVAVKKEVEDLYGIVEEAKILTREELTARTPKILFSNLFSPLLDNPTKTTEDIIRLTELLNKEGGVGKEELSERTQLLSSLAQVNISQVSGQIAQRRRNNRNQQSRSGRTG
jgi:hypothetical protein